MSKAIRVLQVFHGMDCGGAENMIMNLYRNIDRSKVQFDFLVHTKKKCFFDDEIKSLGGRVFHVPYYNVKNHFTYKEILKIFFKKHPEIKVVHGHLGSCAHVYLDVAKFFGCYTIAHSHNTLPTEKNIKNLLYRIFTLRTRKISEYFMACGKQAGIDRFGKKITDSSQYYVLNNAIDSESFSFSDEARKKIREELQIKDKFVIGHIGRFSTQKNHTFLIDIFRSLHEKCHDSVLVLVGEGILRNEIEEKINEYHLSDAVRFTGVREDVPMLLSAMDVFVFPSLYEGLPCTLIEAQANGIDIIASDSITREVDITQTIKFISLKKSKEKWAEEIMKHISGVRNDNHSQIINAGYDINHTVMWLETFYLKSAYKKRDKR